MAKKRRLRKTGALKAPEVEKVQSEVEVPEVEKVQSGVEAPVVVQPEATQSEPPKKTFTGWLQGSPEKE